VDTAARKRRHRNADPGAVHCGVDRRAERGLCEIERGRHVVFVRHIGGVEKHVVAQLCRDRRAITRRQVHDHNAPSQLRDPRRRRLTET